jgi:hypothetical protein
MLFSSRATSIFFLNFQSDRTLEVFDANSADPMFFPGNASSLPNTLLLKLEDLSHYWTRRDLELWIINPKNLDIFGRFC